MIGTILPRKRISFLKIKESVKVVQYFEKYNKTADILRTIPYFPLNDL